MSEAEIIYGNVSFETQELMEIGELGLDIWRVYMIQQLGDELVKQILDGIKADRLGTNFDSKFDEVLHGSIQSFVQVQEYQKKSNLKMYQELFETPMLEASGEFYNVEAFKLLQKCSVSQYMEEVIKKLEDESKRAQKYLHIRYTLSMSTQNASFIEIFEINFFISAPYQSYANNAKNEW